jgi:hypothetical protein
MTALTTNPIRRPGPFPLIVAVVVLAVLGVSALLYAWIGAPAATTVPYSQFLTDVEAGGITRVVQTGTLLEVSGPHGAYTVEVPTILTDVFGDVDHAAAAGGAAAPLFEARPEPDTSWIGMVVAGLLPLVVTLIVFVLALLLVSRSARRDDGRSLTTRLRELDDAHGSGLVSDDEWQRQRARILDEA